MTEQNLVRFDNLDREAILFKEAKNNIEKNTKIIREAIDTNTKNEVQCVQTAIDNLNKKVQKIMETDFVKERSNIIEKSEVQMIKSTKMAAQTFFKVKKIIYDKEELTLEQKQKYEQTLLDKILDKFMTPEEKEMFNKFIKSGSFIINSNRNIDYSNAIEL